MFNSVIAFILGVFVTIWYLVFDFTFNFDHSITVNVVIATATIIATAIHFDSVRKQRKDRLWEINKDSLLRLSKALADAIEMSAINSERELGIPVEESTKDSPEIGQKFEDILSDALNVYKPLLSDHLIFAIEEYQKAEEQTSRDWHVDALTTFEAYDEQWANRKKLQEVVLEFIKDVSGVSYT